MKDEKKNSYKDPSIKNFGKWFPPILISKNSLKEQSCHTKDGSLSLTMEIQIFAKLSGILLIFLENLGILIGIPKKKTFKTFGTVKNSKRSQISFI